MIIEELKVINFRNYQNIHLKFHPRLNIFIGNNAQGKTNLLEAIYICGRGRSFRTNRDQDMINIKKQEAYVQVKLSKIYSKISIDIKLNTACKKNIRVNQMHLTRLGDLFGNLNLVLFSPEDLKLVKEGPSERRKFLDYEISQIHSKYYYSLGQYNKILQHRNRLLKANRNKDLDLEVWNEQLARAGALVIYYRRNFIKKIGLLARLIHRRVTDYKETLEITYAANVKIGEKDGPEELKEKILRELENNMDTDRIRCLTTVGPHRDDIDFKINGMDLRNYGSQGQQRTVVLSLKLAQLELIKGEVGEYPVLLLDDVMSELDIKRQTYLINNLKDVQTFITTATVDHIKNIGLENRKVFHVSRGQIIQPELGNN